MKFFFPLLLSASAALAQFENSFDSTWALLSLQQALQQAMAGNTALKKVESQTVVAQTTQASATGALLPSLTLTSTYSRLGPNLSDDPRSNAASNLSSDAQISSVLGARWVVFDGFALWLTRTAAQKNLVAAQYREATQQRLTRAQCEQAYYGVASYQAQWNVAMQAVLASQERWSIAKARLELGSASQLDVDQSQMNLQADSSVLLARSLSLSQARRQLDGLRGLEIDTIGYRVLEEIPFDSLLDKNELWKKSQDSYPPLLEARAKLEAAKANVNAAQSTWWPELAVFANYNVLNRFYDQEPPADRTYQGMIYGAQLTLPIFQGGRTVAKVDAAQAALDQAKWDEREQTNYLRRNFEDTWQQYLQNLQAWRIERRGLEVSERSWAIAQEKYRIGSLSGVEQRQVQEQRRAAQERALSAQYRVKIAEIQLRLLAGI